MLLCSGNDGKNDFIAYERWEWQIHPDAKGQWKPLCKIPAVKLYSAEFREYYAFDAFCNLSEEIYNALEKRLIDSMDDADVADIVSANVKKFMASCEKIYTNAEKGAEIYIEGSITAGKRIVEYPMANAHFCDGTTAGDIEEDTETKKEIMKVYALLAGIQVN